jgi:hypothetical protein
MEPFTIVAAPRSQRAVLSILADWSSSGLLGPLVWVDDLPENSASRFRSLILTDGGFQAVNLATEIVQQRPESVRIIILVPGLPGSTQLTDAQQTAIIEAVTRAVTQPPSVIRAIIGIDSLHLKLTETSRRGAHNIVVAPEESPEPGGAAPIPAEADPATLAAHTAAAVATLGGVWRSMSAAPLDGLAVSPSGWPQLFRTHVRSMVGDRAEAAIRRETLATAKKNPLPTTQDGSEYIDDVAQATGDFARALIREHRKLLVSARVKTELDQVRKIRLGEAFKMFFSFLLASLNPVAWVRAKLAGAVDAAGSALTNALFGSDSRYQIALGASLESRIASLDSLDDGLAKVKPKVHEPAGSFAPLWKDFMAGALTLIDGGDRSGVLAPIRVGSAIGVLRTAAQSAPAVDTDFIVDPSLGLPPRLASVEAADYLGFAELVALLEQRAAESGGHLAAGEADRLQAWRRDHTPAYTVQVGTLLGQQIERLSEEINGYLAQLAPEPEDLQRIARLQKRLARRLLVILVAAVVVLVAVFVCLGLAVISGLTAAILVLLTVLGWLIGSLVAFVKGQQAFFAELHRRQMLVTQSQALEQNLRAASRDLRLCIDAYRQFLRWSDVAASVLAEPFGRVAERTAQQRHQLVGLPANVRIGEFELPDDAVLHAAARLRRFFFRPSWLTAIWESVVSDVGRRLGPAAIDLMQKPELIFASRAGEDDPLALWSESLQLDGPGETARTRAWQTMSDELAAKSEDYGLSQAGLVVEGNQAPRPAHEFLARLVNPRPGSDFDLRLLEASAVVEDAAQVDGAPWVNDRQSVLTRVVVRAEFGAGFSPSGLALAGAENGQRGRVVSGPTGGLV